MRIKEAPILMIYLYLESYEMYQWDYKSLCFQMKILNEVDTILRIKVESHSCGYMLNQCHYNNKIIDMF